MVTGRLPSIPERWKPLLLRDNNRRTNREINERVQPANHQYQITEDYVPEPYDGRVLLFRSELHQTGRFRDPALGWGELVQGEFEVRELPGDHQWMFNEPVVHMMSELLAEELNNLQTAGRSDRSSERPVSTMASSLN